MSFDTKCTKNAKVHKVHKEGPFSCKDLRCLEDLD